LGPVTGTALQSRFGSKISVYGTLEHPVHALNLTETLTHIRHDSFLIAVDACLGVHIGSVTLSEGSLLPGAGVNNSLPAVGHLSITGIVGSSHGNALNNLSTAKLGKVLELSDIISEALCTSLNKYLY
jgi:putative sporulation protein YyaC